MLSYQMSKLHWEAAVWIVLNVHHFSVVGQDEKLTTSVGGKNTKNTKNNKKNKTFARLYQKKQND